MQKQSIPVYKKVLLSPFSWLWESIYFTRRAFYDYGLIRQSSFHVPVISIGNLTFGGTGKTPFTLWLGQYLNSQNKEVMVLMRGYKGKLENSSGIIHTGKMIPDSEDYGDEALLFARRLKNSTVVVGKRRAQNLSFYFPKVRPDVVLLDDGHQHIQIKRKLNIVLFDATMPMIKYEVAPLGYMREGFHALKDADLVVIGKADIAGKTRVEELKNLIRPHLPVGVNFAEIGFRPKGLFNAANEMVYSVSEIKGKKVICLAGIANPISFYKLIEELGAEIIVKESFPDHHYFKKDEIQALIESAKNEDAILVTTEKDMVRIKKIIEDNLILFLDVDIQFYSGEEETKELIDKAIEF